MDSTILDKKKEMLPENLHRIIERNSRIFIGSGCSEPTILTEQLVLKKWEYTDCEIIHFLTISDNKFFDDRDPSLFRHQALFIGKSIRNAVNEGKADYIPVSLSDIPKLIISGRIPIDVSLLQVSPPDRFGYCSLGIDVDINRTVIDTAKINIAQINPQMPRTSGDSFIHISKIDYYVYHDSPLLTFEYPPMDKRSKKIGKYIARLIENESTIQFGIGTIPNAVLARLHDKKDLAIYSEVLSDSVIPLIESGVVNCSKNQYPHVMTSFIMGSKKLYDFVDNNPFIEFHPTTLINSIFNIAKNHKQVSINSALSVSLTGQVNSDSIGSFFYSGVGGQFDFTHGASLSEHGKPIICLPSTANNGKKSRILSTLDKGAGVTIPRHMVHYVVTEFGIAHIFGRSIRNRVLQMISIAHPDFRDQLLKDAKEMNYIYKDQTIPMLKNGIPVIYPEEYETIYASKTKGDVYFRPIKMTDEKQVQDVYYKLDQNDRIMRFFSPKKTFTHSEILPKVVGDYKTDFLLVGYIKDKYDEDVIIALGGYYLNPNTNLAEIAFTVSKEYRNQGLTKFMVHYLIRIAKEQGVSGFDGYVLKDNPAMLHIIQSVPFEVIIKSNVDEYEFSFNFSNKKEKSAIENNT